MFFRLFERDAFQIHLTDVSAMKCLCSTMKCLSLKLKAKKGSIPKPSELFTAHTIIKAASK